MLGNFLHICFLIEYSASIYQLLSVTYVNEWNVNGYVLTRTCVSWLSCWGFREQQFLVYCYWGRVIKEKSVNKDNYVFF